MKSGPKRIRASPILKRTRKKSFQAPARGRDVTASRPRILVPIDFSECSRGVLQYAVSLARPLRANLLLLYVAEIHPAGSELGPTHLPELESELRQMAKQQMAALRKQGIPPEIAAETVLRAGRSESQILEVAASLNVSLIIMGTHSKDSRHGQLGTTAGRVASLATCPVLLVPPKEVSIPFFL